MVVNSSSVSTALSGGGVVGAGDLHDMVVSAAPAATMRRIGRGGMGTS